MKFRLTYEGPLRPTQGEARDNQKNPLATHKQEIRKIFHHQLKQFWKTNKYLNEATWLAEGPNISRPPSDSGGAESIMPVFGEIPLNEGIARLYERNGYRFVPLVREDNTLLCSLDILFLRRDIPGSIIHAGDIDNRIKTLIDALRMPNNAKELVGNEAPSADENPFYCLLEDDKLVSHFSVETDTLLTPTSNVDADVRVVKIVITVSIRPYYVTMENLNYS